MNSSPNLEPDDYLESLGNFHSGARNASLYDSMNNRYGSQYGQVNEMDEYLDEHPHGVMSQEYSFLKQEGESPRSLKKCKLIK